MEQQDAVNLSIQMLELARKKDIEGIAKLQKIRDDYINNNKIDKDVLQKILKINGEIVHIITEHRDTAAKELNKIKRGREANNIYSQK